MSTPLTSEPPNLSAYLEDLREGTVKLTAAFIGALGYAWIFYNFWTVYINQYYELLLSSWIGGWILGIGAVLSFVVGSDRLRLSAFLLTACILSATVCAVLALATPSFLYVLAVPVIFAGVLIGQRGLLGAVVVVIARSSHLKSSSANT
ncbi:MAG: hypothetical protein ACP5HG_03060 [Anaerolineae bacterium]